MSNAEDFVTVLYEAMNEDLGTIIEVSDTKKALQKLYKARKADPDFACLSFSPSKIAENQILITKKPQEA